MSKTLEKKITSRQATIAIIGLGYVGLPLAVCFARKGFQVLGLDKDRDRVFKVQKKESYILDVPGRELRRLVEDGYLRASMDFKGLSSADVILICVPTPLKTQYTPDISYLLGAVREIRRFLKKETLVVLESTTYPGTTRELIQPELEKSGLKAGEDFHLAFSPERIDPGNKTHNLARIPKVVGGINRRSGELTKLLYERIIRKVHLVSSPEVAEMTKLLENSFRIINIGWINEVAMMCHKMAIDVGEVIGAAKTKPFGFMPFYPGLGVGGHCIPEDPLYLYWKAKHAGFHSRFIKLAAEVNGRMPRYALGRLQDILKKEKKSLALARVLVVGVTYKKDVKDLRKSPSLKLIELLQKARCQVDYFDPMVPYLKIGKIHLKGIALTQRSLVRFDCVIIAVDHTGVNYPFLLRHSRWIFDIRNVYRKQKDPKVIRF